MSAQLSTMLGVAALTLIAYAFFTQTSRPLTPLPHMNETKDSAVSFIFQARRLLGEGRHQYPTSPYRLRTNVGDTVVLPPTFAHEIRNEKDLSFREAFAMNFHPSIPGFDGFAAGYRDDELLQRVVKKWITKLLNQITEPLAVEAEHAIGLHFGAVTNEWQTFSPQTPILDVVSRLSSRVFLGAEVCRNEDWLAISKSYTVQAFSAAESIRDFPSWTRPFVHWYKADCKRLRQQVKEARVIIGPVLQTRRDLRASAQRDGEPVPIFNDAIDWFEQESKGVVHDPVGMQLGLAAVAIHTTTDLVSETILRLAQDSTLQTDLREEIAGVVHSQGWQKSALFNLKLLDSVLKETQRLKPITSVNMNRIAIHPITLPDGTRIAKGENTVVDIGGMRDPELYPSPNTFDGYRFVRMREDPGKEQQAHLVATSPSHLGFGHGLHACPGRFFAANEAKVIMAKLLTDFEFATEDGYVHQWEEHGFAMSYNSAAKLRIRRIKS